jgi:hypothetical protein
MTRGGPDSGTSRWNPQVPGKILLYSRGLYLGASLSPIPACVCFKRPTPALSLFLFLSSNFTINWLLLYLKVDLNLKRFRNIFLGNLLYPTTFIGGCGRQVEQGSGDFWDQPAKIHPFTTSTSFLRIWPVANLMPFIWTGQYPIFFQVPANFFFIVMTTGQELGHR